MPQDPNSSLSLIKPATAIETACVVDGGKRRTTRSGSESRQTGADSWILTFVPFPEPEPVEAGRGSHRQPLEQDGDEDRSKFLLYPLVILLLSVYGPSVCPFAGRGNAVDIKNNPSGLPPMVAWSAKPKLNRLAQACQPQPGRGAVA